MINTRVQLLFEPLKVFNCYRFGCFKMRKWLCLFVKCDNFLRKIVNSDLECRASFSNKSNIEKRFKSAENQVCFVLGFVCAKIS